MTYSVSNPPVLLAQGVGSGGSSRKIWFYASTDASTAVDASGYFTDGWKLGMRAGDIVFVLDTDASPLACQICIVTSASSSAVDLSDGVAITATDSD